MLTKEQLLGNNIWVADNFDEEFITRFKLGQKILVTFKIGKNIYNELIVLGKDNHHFYAYECSRDRIFDIVIVDDNIFEYCRGLYNRMAIKELSLEWLNNFIEWGKY